MYRLGSLDEQVLVITDYIKFCMDFLILLKTIRTYSNSKPWINSQIKYIFQKRKLAFRQKDSAGLKNINQDITNEIFMAKNNYKNKLEQDFANMNTKQAFQRVTGQAFKRTTCISDPTIFASNLNNFYACFETSDSSAECDSLLNSLPFQELNYESLLNQAGCLFPAH